jgi:hypothetical protein
MTLTASTTVYLPVSDEDPVSHEVLEVAFDAAVRWESPVQTFFRTATTDVPSPGTSSPRARRS